MSEGSEQMDARVAAAALLVETALADGVYAQVEETRITALLGRAFGVDNAEAAEILAAAEDLAEQSGDLERFTRAVTAGLTPEARAALVEQLWSVALADGEKAPVEDSFILRLAPLLGVGAAEAGRARARAEAAGAKR